MNFNKNSTFNCFVLQVRLRIGIYHIYLEDWFSKFDKKQFLILKTEDYAADLKKSITNVYKFLELKPLSKKDSKRIFNAPRRNTRRPKDREVGDMLPITRQLLNNFYRPHNLLLAKLLQDDRFRWDS